MKRLLLIIMAFSLYTNQADAQIKKKAVSAVPKVEVKKGSIEVKISYYFNEAQGQKADVGAKVFLFKKTDKIYKSDFINYYIGSMVVDGTEDIINADYREEADISGTVRILDVPYGKYMLVVASKGRKIYSKKDIVIDAPNKIFVKNFGYTDEMSNEGESW